MSDRVFDSSAILHMIYIFLFLLNFISYFNFTHSKVWSSRGVLFIILNSRTSVNEKQSCQYKIRESNDARTTVNVSVLLLSAGRRVFFFFFILIIVVIKIDLTTVFG